MGLVKVDEVGGQYPILFFVFESLGTCTGVPKEGLRGPKKIRGNESHVLGL